MEYYTYIHKFSWAILTMFLFLFLEISIAYLKKHQVHTFMESFTNLACGLLERIAFLAFAFVYYFTFSYLFENYRLFDIPINLFSIVLLFFLVDFIWYVYHRLGHRVNIMWAAHITHHQSKDYNLTVSFRVSILQLMIRLLFWSLLPILGFNPTITLTIVGINAAYQFFIHTSLIGKLGILEKFMVTPSHHRVHHGKNEAYIDKNYGGFFIIWDKIFNTYQPEGEPVQFGITKELESHNPLHAWFHYFKDLINASRAEQGLKNKINVWFAPPESLSQFYQTQKKPDPNTNISGYSYQAPIHLKGHLIIQMSWLVVILYITYANFGSAIPITDVPIFLLMFLVSILSLHNLFKLNKLHLMEIARITIACLLIKIIGTRLEWTHEANWAIAIFLLTNLLLLYHYKAHLNILLRKSISIKHNKRKYHGS
jgi:alkylglycerol monooxygenase